MYKVQLRILLISVFFSCQSRGKVSDAKGDTALIDSTILQSAAIRILGKQYHAISTNDLKLIVLDFDGDTILNAPDCFQFEFQDFNSDSLSDIIVHHPGNNSTQDLYLFDAARKGFTSVRDFVNFPDARNIQGTNFYYSYHRSGCADNLWDSDLFYIENFQARHLANISGNECEGEVGIVVSKMIGKEKMTIERLKLDVLSNYSDRKWGFIADYWLKNHAKFTQ